MNNMNKEWRKEKNETSGFTSFYKDLPLGGKTLRFEIRKHLKQYLPRALKPHFWRKPHFLPKYVCFWFFGTQKDGEFCRDEDHRAAAFSNGNKGMSKKSLVSLINDTIKSLDLNNTSLDLKDIYAAMHEKAAA